MNDERISMERKELIQKRISADLSEGIMAIRLDGVIEYVNDAALKILQRERDELIGSSFAGAFFTEVHNDELIQCVLDAVYSKTGGIESYVPYNTGESVRQLRIVSSYLKDDETAIGVVLVISDITELTEMRDAVRAMETIRGLNRQLELRNQLLQEMFGRYLSDDIVKEILEKPEGWKLGGQKRVLTILMNDLRGFTAMSERMEPQDLIHMLNHFFGIMYEEVERYHGTLIEYLGDSMFVIFGAPAPTDTHAADAIAAALSMQKRMEDVNRWNAEQGYEPLSMGVGINTDSVILGNIGSERRTKYGVLGPAVNLTGRIESCTTEGQVMIFPNTREAVHVPLEIEKTMSVSLKGVAGEITISSVTGIGGPYQVTLEREASALLATDSPVPVSFFMMDGKHREEEQLAGSIVELSEKEAVLKTDAPLAPLDDLCLEIGGELYAKVTELTEKGARICFTATPPSFEGWMEHALTGKDPAP